VGRLGDAPTYDKLALDHGSPFMAAQAGGQAKVPGHARAADKSTHPNEIGNGRLSLSPNAPFTALRYLSDNRLIQI
jgi:hypothetical protein